jgi:hypothetical protein
VLGIMLCAVAQGAGVWEGASLDDKVPREKQATCNMGLKWPPRRQIE